MKSYFILFLFLLFDLTIPAQNIHKRDSLIKVLKSNPSDKVLVETYLQLGNIYQSNSPDSAKWYFEKADIKSQKLGDYDLQVKSLIGLGNCYSFQGDYKKALDLHLKSLAFSKRMNSKFKIANCYSNIGIIYANQGIYDTTILYFQKSLSIFQDIKDTNGIAKCYNNIGTVYKLQGKFDSAIKEYDKSLEIDINKNKQADLAIDYFNMGAAYFGKGDFSSALNYYYKSLKIREDFGDKIGVAQCFNNIAIAHSSMHNNDKAVEYYNKSLAIRIEIGDQRGMASCYNNIGSQFYESRNYPKALEFFFKSLDIRKTLNDLDGICQCNGNIAVVYADMGRDKEALSCYFQNIKAYKMMDDKESLSSTYINIGSSNISLGDNLAAINFLNKGLSLAQEIKSLDLQRNGYQLLSVSYSKIGDYKKALDYYKVFKQINDSIYSSKSREQLNILETNYQTEKKELEINRLKQQNEFQQLLVLRQKNRNQVIIIVCSSLVVLLLLTGFIIYISRKRKHDRSIQHQMAYITQLKMMNIRNRISPHFVFNVLNHEVIAESNEGDRFELQGLIKLLRQSLEVTESLCVSLQRELDFVKTYIDIERRSLGDNFLIQCNVDERIILDTFLLPSMIIQIPVENAIKHALRGKDGEKVLNIDLEKQTRGVLISIVDNGAGFMQTHVNPKGTGTGLRVIYQTIELLNAKNQEKITFDISANEGSFCGTRVLIYIPRNYSYVL